MVSVERLTKGHKLVQGVGVNDADYTLHRHEVINGKRKVVWACPYYTRWVSLFQRCYSEKEQNRYPTYRGCTVCNEWLTFSNFKAWMETQDWEGKHIDKDLLIVGNKVYSSETCVFIPAIVNTFITDSNASRGSLPIGVSRQKCRYRTQCRDPFKIRKARIGSFKTPEEAHQAWKKRKHQYATELANSEYVTDERVRQALLTRYL